MIDRAAFKKLENGSFRKYVGRNQWYAAVWSQDLAEAPLARRLLNEPIVLFRTKDGSVAALADACPHRFVPLSMGQVIDGSSIRCAYHGLAFDRAGACVHNPHTSGRIPPAAKVRTYPVEERHGMVWLWMGSRAPDPTFIPDLSILDEAPAQLVSAREWLVMKAGYALVVENLLDLSHASILHDGLLGNAEMADAEISVKEEGDDLIVSRMMRDTAPPRMLDLLYRGDGGRIDSWNNVRLTGVSTLINELGITDANMNGQGGTGMKGIHILSPIDEVSSYYHFCSVRVSPPERTMEENLAIRQEMSVLRTRAFAEQDGPVLEAQQAALLDAAVDTSRPAMFDIDIGSSRFARRLAHMLKEDQDQA